MSASQLGTLVGSKPLIVELVNGATLTKTQRYVIFVNTISFPKTNINEVDSVNKKQE